MACSAEPGKAGDTGSGPGDSWRQEDLQNKDRGEGSKPEKKEGCCSSTADMRGGKSTLEGAREQKIRRSGCTDRGIPEGWKTGIRVTGIQEKL